MNDSWISLLLDKIEILPHNVFDYTKIELHRIDLFSTKAAFLIFTIRKDIRHERWIPYSQLKKDNNDCLWLSKWMIKNLKLKEEKKYSPQETSGEIICGDYAEDYRF